MRILSEKKTFKPCILAPITGKLLLGGQFAYDNREDAVKWLKKHWRPEMGRPVINIEIEQTLLP